MEYDSMFGASSLEQIMDFLVEKLEKALDEDDNYCSKCESIIAYVKEFNRECECAWCELNGKCKYFQELDNIPDNKQVIKMWLEGEDDDGI